MVLTDRQRSDLHAGIYEYLLSQPGDAFARAASALADADPIACERNSPASPSSAANNAEENGENGTSAAPTAPPKVPILEKKWTAVPRLQKKVLELERVAAQNASIYAHRSGIGLPVGDGAGGGLTAGSNRRMLPRPPCVHTLKGHSGVVSCVAVHPVFTLAVSGSEDGTIKVWDHESGEYIRTLKGHTNTVHSLSFTPTGSHLASSSSDLSIKLWDFSTYSCIRTLRGHDHTISALKFIPSPASVVSAALAIAAGGGGGHAAGGGAGRGTATGEATSSSSATGIDASIAGTSVLVSTSRDRTVKFWDMETGFCDKTLSDHTDWVRCVAVKESDGSLLATSGNDQCIIVYDLTSGSTTKKVAELRGHEHVVETVAFVTAPTPAATSAAAAELGGTAIVGRKKKTAAETKHDELIGDYIASGGRDRTVRLWSVSAAQCLSVFRAHENWVRSVLIHPSGNYIIGAGDDRTLRVFDIKSNRCLRTIDNAHPHFVTSIGMHHKLPVLVSGGVDQTVKCWQLD